MWPGKRKEERGMNAVVKTLAAVGDGGGDSLDEIQTGHQHEWLVKGAV